MGRCREGHLLNVRLWTIDIVNVDDSVIEQGKKAIGDLVRGGLPDEQEKPPDQRSSVSDLRAVAIISRRVHWREVGVEFWTNVKTGAVKLLGFIAEAENDPLTRFLAGYQPIEERKRFIRRD